ncbi:hypothetical protein L6452_44459 [Arctium lappa]|uniref:Uncharacterized protein n=1 Tax=Arctium lappa TaxID=4217 RepID=A0ACB8XG65_ARCLA|nr:hypothetical protein L6452_44459 [Arctium lappa]
MLTWQTLPSSLTPRVTSGFIRKSPTFKGTLVLSHSSTMLKISPLSSLSFAPILFSLRKAISLSLSLSLSIFCRRKKSGNIFR